MHRKRLKFQQYVVMHRETETFLPNETGLGPRPSKRPLSYLSEANPRLFNTERAATSAILQYRRLNPYAPMLEVKPVTVGIELP